MAASGITGGAADAAAIQQETIPSRPMTDTTRYLCAAAELDAALRDWIFAHIVYEEHKSIGPSHGVDLATVVRHCLAARRRQILRDMALTLLLVAAGLGLYGVWNRGSSPSPVVPIASAIAAWLVILIEMWITRYTIVASQLTRGRSSTKGYTNVRLNPDLQRRLGEHARVRGGNVVVYSGFSPFVGAGIPVDGWSFALNIGKGKEDIGGTIRKPQPFQVSDLYQYVAVAIGKLRLDGLSIEDKLFVRGQDIRDDPMFVPNRYASPLYDVRQDVVDRFVENPSQSVRHYKCFRVVSWKGELVLSIFVRFSLVGQDLFVEASYHVLPPLKEQYRKVDAVQPIPTWRQRGHTLLQALGATPLLWIRSPLALLTHPLNAYGRLQDHQRAIRLINESPTFDYGADRTLREQASSSTYHQYFQRLDKEMYTKLIERHLLDSIIAFLDSHDIDTSDLKERQTAIMNSGTLIAGNVQGFVQGSNANVDMSFGNRVRLVGSAGARGKTNTNGASQAAR